MTDARQHADPLAALRLPPEADTLALHEIMETALQAQPFNPTSDPVDVRAAHDAEARRTRPRAAEARDGQIETAAGRRTVRLFVPHEVRSVYLYIHGGAWIMGANDLADHLLWGRAQGGHTAVVSLDYRLAPENPWPHALDDCTAAAEWLADHALEEFGTDRLLIGGDSAGAHLAVATLLALRDEHGSTKFCGADLRYGMYDMRLTPSVRNHRGRAFDAQMLSWVLDHVFPATLREQPLVSPLLAELQGLPPALFTVGTYDSLLDDTLFMWARWRAAGNLAELSLHPGGGHAFDYLDTAEARRALEASVGFIRDVTSAPRASCEGERCQRTAR